MIKFTVTVLVSILISTTTLATVDRTLTVSNNCEFDLSWANIGNQIIHNGELMTCEAGMTTCYEDNGVCGTDGLCYYKPPTIKFGIDNNDENFLRSKSSKIYDLKLIQIDNIEQYILSIAAQIGCKKDKLTSKISCTSGDCEVEDNLAQSSQCSPASLVKGPYTLANITYRNKSNDEYYISLEKGINIPIAITPIADYYGEQNFQDEFFCNKVGVDNCNWYFDVNNIPGNIPPHIITQIDRDTNDEITSLCQKNSDCQEELSCGLKYPEDLINYSGTGYCGDPIAYYNPITMCSTDLVSNEIKKLFGCSYNINNPGAPEIIFDINTAIEDRCPDNFIEVSLNGIENSEKRFCMSDLFSCKSRIVSINDTSYNYLDSCYNYKPGSPESSACCGCIDWPGISSDERALCMPANKTDAPNPCSVDFSSNPPDCKAKFDTKTSKANAHWIRFVQPYLKWIVDGCNQAKEYSHGDKHATQYCSSQKIPTKTGNNINYLVTMCPSGFDLFTNKNPEKKSHSLKQYIYDTNKIVKSRFEGNVNTSTLLIISIFLFLSLILVIYFIIKRDKP